MTPEMIDLARRAVACKGWRWMAGMRYRLHPAHPWFRYDGADCSDGDGAPIGQASPDLQSPFVAPDLTDPATLGCLLALVREAWGDPTAHVEPSYEGKWRAWAGRYSADNPPISRSTEAEALVAALEAA